MTAREAARRYGARSKRAAAGFATSLLHHLVGHDPRRRPEMAPSKVQHGMPLCESCGNLSSHAGEFNQAASINFLHEIGGPGQ